MSYKMFQVSRSSYGVIKIIRERAIKCTQSIRNLEQSLALPSQHVTLSDNKRIYCTKHDGSTADESIETLNENQQPNANEASKSQRTKNIPWAVKKIRENLREIHNLPSTSRRENPIKSVLTIGPEEIDEGSVDIQSVAPITDSQSLQDKFPFLRKRRPKRQDKVIETGYGYIFVDNKHTPIRQNKMSNSTHKQNIPKFPKVSPDTEQSHTAVTSMIDIVKPVQTTESNIFDKQYFNLPDTVDHNLSSSKVKDDTKDKNDITADNTSVVSDKQELHGYRVLSKQSSSDDLSLIDQYCFENFSSGAKSTIQSADDQKDENPNSSSVCVEQKSGDKLNFIDEQYFGDTKLTESKITKNLNGVYSKHQADNAEENVKSVPLYESSSPRPNIHTRTNTPQNISDLNEVDAQYFGNMNSMDSMENVLPKISKSDTSDTLREYGHTRPSPEEDGDTAHNNKSHKRAHNLTSKLEKSLESEPKNIFVETVTKQKMRYTTRPEVDTENPKSAYDMAMKIRHESRQKGNKDRQIDPGTVPREARWSGQTDSQGWRILTHQVLDIQNMARNVVVDVLGDSVLYQDDELIAIDKPYGLPSHGGPGVHHSVGQLSDQLASRLDTTGSLDTVHLVHRLDKETTGVMLLAKNMRSKAILQAMFRERKVLKKYWVLTKGIPNPSEGVIDIPMMEGTVGDRHRMALSPHYRIEQKLMYKTSRNDNRSEAITNYRVLDSNHECALVECQPESGVKHQIRCHMAFALNTPILGDHKYSHYSKMAPQKLHPHTLRRLGIRQAKVRHLPMHLHAKLLILPEYKDGQNLFISARLPRHFVQNMKWLKIKPPDK